MLRAAARVLACLIVPAMLLAACATEGQTTADRSAANIFGSAFNVDDLRARQPRQSRGSGGGAYDETRTGGVVQFGRGQQRLASGPLPPALSRTPNGEFNLNFENADLGQVLQAVLGEALRLNYTIAPEVTGVVTVSTARPLSRDELLETLERVLQMNGAAMTRSGEGYAIVAQASATAGRADNARTPGYGMTVLPLQHVSADAVLSLIEGFGSRPGAVRVERARNLLVFLGSSPDRQSAIETALSFDVDWMEGQSVGVFPLRRAKAEAVIPELERIFKSGEAGLGGELVQFSRVVRVNGILVVAQKPELLSRARSWIDRLDSSDRGLDAQVHVYRVKYRDAQRLANLLNQIFTTSAEAEAPAAPEGPAVAQTAFDRNIADRLGEAEGETPDALPAVFSADPAAQLRIRADNSNNSVVIYANADKRREILAALHQIDVPQLQVAINVTMAEIRLNEDLRYGVQYFLKSRNLGLGDNQGSIGVFNTIANTIGRELPGFNLILGSEQSPEIIIDAFDSITDVQILSSPSLVVMDNETARFQVGDQIPVVTRTVTGVQNPDAPVSNEVVYRDTGVILQVRPRVSENGVVSMVIEQEISAVTAGASSLTPTISNRLVSSAISVVDGQTVLLGGLISEQLDGSKSGIPGLHRMKGIGGLFGRTGRANNRTEVIILIRPSVIRESQDAQHVAEELRAKMWGLGSKQVR